MLTFREWAIEFTSEAEAARAYWEARRKDLVRWAYDPGAKVTFQEPAWFYFWLGAAAEEV